MSEEIRIRNFSTGNFIVLGHVEVTRYPRSPTEPDVWLLLRNQKSRKRLTTIVASGLLPYVHSGYQFTDKTLVSLTSSNQTKIKISIDTNTTEVIELALLVDDKQLKDSFAIMRTLKERASSDSTWHILRLCSKNQDITLLLPAFVGLQFYWCRTSRLTQLFLTCGITDSESLSKC